PARAGDIIARALEAKGRELALGALAPGGGGRQIGGGDERLPRPIAVPYGRQGPAEVVGGLGAGGAEAQRLAGGGHGRRSLAAGQPRGGQERPGRGVGGDQARGLLGGGEAGVAGLER